MASPSGIIIFYSIYSFPVTITDKLTEKLSHKELLLRKTAFGFLFWLFVIFATFLDSYFAFR
jgi:hypothetical protein